MTTLHGYTAVKEWLEAHAHRTFYPKNQTEFGLLSEVLTCHPNYTSWKHQEPTGFKITRAPKTKSLLVHVKFTGTKRWRPVSWVACAKGKVARIPSQQNQLTQAMRFAVRVQIRNWRTRNTNRHSPPTCELCRSSTVSKLEVDHFPEAFAALRDQFIAKQGPGPMAELSFYWDKKRTSYRFKRGEKLNTSWQRFHSKHAAYRWLCGDCNKRSQKRVKGE